MKLFFFCFQPINKNCDILQDALTRYWGILLADSAIRSHSAKHLKRKKLLEVIEDNNFGGYLESLDVYLHNECEDTPHPNMDEECKNNQREVAQMENLKLIFVN